MTKLELLENLAKETGLTKTVAKKMMEGNLFGLDHQDLENGA